MSIEWLCGLVCDKCGQSTGGIARYAKDARDEGLRQGWGGGHSGHDYCPLCVKPLPKPRVDRPIPAKD